MEAIFLIGVQGAGKSTFYRHTFFDTHLRINLDQLRTRHREAILIRAALEAKMRFVWDNTNATRFERRRVLELTMASGFRTFGYYFEPNYEASTLRNAARSGRARVPDVALKNTLARLEKPDFAEGFEAIFSVWNRGAAGFQIEEWNREV
ncbi:MAG: ATP-binding protein [Armatimonadetes bacterium]|nr:ATP-binding protein [Armatimonadota bacterium]